MKIKTPELSTAALMLVVVFWGTLLGGITYSHLVFFPVYLSDLPNSAVLVNGPYALSEGVFWLVIHPLLIISLIATLILNWNSRARRNLVVLSFAVYIAVLVITLIYFMPELVLFRNSPQSTLQASEWLPRGRLWQRLSWARGFIMYLAFVPLLGALTQPAADSRELLP